MHIHIILSDKGTDVATVGPRTTALQAARTMAERNIGCLLVLDNHELVGIVSERDLARALGIMRDVADLEVRQVMSADVITCHPDDTIESVMSTMTNRRIRHVPVIDDEGTLRGIVSIGDVVKRRLDELAAESAALQEYIAVGR
jgi:CBS domain-containing protein